MARGDPLPRAPPVLLLALLIATAPMLLAAAQPAPATVPADTVRIALLDSGILPTHPEFEADQVVAWKDFVNGQNAPYDDHGHGTAVASRAAGSTIGSAPGTQLIIGKVLDKNNFGTWGNVAAGIRWAADMDADVISVSIWAGNPDPLAHGFDNYAHVFLSQAIAYATSQGSLVIWISGNGGQHQVPYSTTRPGSASPQALIVGAVDDNGNVAPFSQRDPELVAPGWNVPIAWRDGNTYHGSGTSYAAPWIAGAAAQLLHDGAPQNDPDWLKWVLTHSAQDRPHEPYLHEGYGWLGPVQLEAARAIARGDAPMPGPDARDIEHAPTMTARVAQSGAAPTGALPP